MGNIYAEHHRYREAAKAHSQALSIKPNDPDVRTSLGILLRSWGDDDEAIEEFKRAAQYGPKHANSHYHLGLTLLQNKRNIPEGIKAWEDYLESVHKLCQAVMPDSIRHPETLENTGFRLSPE